MAALGPQHPDLIPIDFHLGQLEQARGRPKLAEQHYRAASDDDAELVLGVHEALERLEQLQPRLATVVEYQYFGGWTQSEIAEALGVSRKTVSRDWRAARAWLAKALEGSSGDVDAPLV